MAVEKKTVAKPATDVAKVEAPKVETPVVKAEAPKAAPAAKEEKKAPAKKAAAKKPAAKKAPAKKPAEVVKKAAAKPAAKKAPVKKAAAPAKKAEIKSNVVLQFSDDRAYTEADLIKIAKDVWQYDLNKKVSDIKSVQLYVKPLESKVYYVINDDVTGDFGI